MKEIEQIKLNIKGEHPIKDVIKAAESIKIIDKGWSGDLKFDIKTKDKRYLLRVAINKDDTKKMFQVNMLKMLEDQHLNIPTIVSFYHNEPYFYTLLTYIEGLDLEPYLKQATSKKAYQLGLSAGQILKQIHSTKLDIKNDDWYLLYEAKTKRKIEHIKTIDVKLDALPIIIQYLQENMHKLKNQKMKLQHGDFHVGNMLFNQDQVFIIDFDKCAIADPYDDFKPFVWNVWANPYFATGIIDGYFDFDVPKLFFEILAVYAADSIIGHIPWAMRFDDKEVETAYKVSADILKWYANFKLMIPSWYQEDAKTVYR